MGKEPRVALIWAMGDNRVIGKDNDLPWRLPADLKHFKAMTLGKPVIMGRKTFDSIGRPLPGRTNIVVTRRADYRPDGVVVVNDLDEAITVGRQAAERDDKDEFMVIGGAEIYALMLDRAERLYVTEVHGEFDGDAFFPPFDLERWVEISRETHASTAEDRPAHSFVVLDVVEPAC
ncbi:dihydrofolate reductase [Pelagibius sp. Alg239-R121]|uniref:dihydrofolate reductase n=1 Tax=Pelagibius sp. Alg239-R121 TaxID=2993448 RepID=UPI0024A67B6F|nr:dihydrofolate reductase [Pelagibius sp. Alg239-R121]